MVYTDAFKSYNDLNYDYMHNVINHAEKYVEGNVHTKGTIGGAYVSVEPFHLFRYLDEQAFRFNRRKGTDSDRFFEVLSMVVGKRLQFAELVVVIRTHKPVVCYWLICLVAMSMKKMSVVTHTARLFGYGMDHL